MSKKDFHFDSSGDGAGHGGKAPPQDRPNYFSVIPASVRDDKRLPASARLLYGDISSLTRSEGFCWASNPWFARKLGVSTRAVSKLVTCLQKAGHIRVEVMNGNERRIWLTLATAPDPTNKSSTAMEQKFHHPRTKVPPPLYNKYNNKENTHSGSPEPQAGQKSGPHPERIAFIALWSAAYEDVFGVSYKVQGGKDGKAADSLLVLRGTSPEGLIELARKAWDHGKEFNCKHAVSLAGFASRFNEIRSEVGAIGPQSKTKGF